MDEMQTAANLPYRTTPEDVARFVEARGRGRDLAQIQTLNFTSAGFQGTLAAVNSFGLANGETSELTSDGRKFALAAATEKQSLLRAAILRFPSYELLLDAVFSKGQQTETPVQWIETWWSTNGYGNSQTNREEGAIVFAKFAEYAGLGTFLIGRRGKPTRIEWKAGAREAVRAALNGTSEAGTRPSIARPTLADLSSLPLLSETGGPGDSTAANEGVEINSTGSSSTRNTLTVSLGFNRAAQISVPYRLTLSEKQRLAALLDLMVEVEVALTAPVLSDQQKRVGTDIRLPEASATFAADVEPVVTSAEPSA